jgi:protein SCO1/2
MKRALFLAAVLLISCAAAPFDPFGEARIDERPGAQIPVDRPLRDENGAPTSLARLGQGRPIVLVPVLHDCPNLCGVTLDGLASAMQAAGIVGDRDASVVAFGIDPSETPADARGALGRLAGRYPAGLGRIHGTVGREPAIRAVTDALGYRFAYDPRIGQFAHAAAIAVLTTDGRFSRWLYGIAPEPAALTAALRDAREGRTGGWTRRLLLLCYHYDPQTGRYRLAIDWLLRTAGIATVLAVLLYVVLARRRESARRC